MKKEQESAIIILLIFLTLFILFSNNPSLTGNAQKEIRQGTIAEPDFSDNEFPKIENADENDLRIMAGGEYCVDDDGNCAVASGVVDCDSASAGYSTIQSAINVASSGDTIYVCAGIYNPAVYLNKSLIFLGANAGIHPAVGTHPSETVGGRNPESIINGTWYIRAPNITIDGFKFSYGGRNIQLTNNAVNNNMTNLHVTNNIFTAEIYNSKGMINAETATNVNCSNLLVDFNLWTGEYYDGIRFYANTTKAVITYNDFTTPVGVGVYHGLYWFGNTYNLIIRGNNFENDVANEINVFSGLEITDNHFYGQDAYFSLRFGGENITVVNNVFENQLRSWYYPTYNNSYPPSHIAIPYSTWNLSNVNIEKNNFTYNEYAGYDGAYSHAIRIFNSTGPGGTDLSNISLHNNTFINMEADNRSLALQNNVAGDLNAEENYWGTNVQSEIANLINGSVDYDPWLCEAYPTSLISIDGSCIFGNEIVGNVSATGITITNVTVNGTEIDSQSYLGEQEVEILAGNQTVVEFTYNFSEGDLNLSLITIKVDSGSMIVNMSQILQPGFKKTVYFDVSGFNRLCVKDAEVVNISQVNRACNGANETILNQCLHVAGPYTNNGITCTKNGTMAKIENLNHTALLAYYESAPSAGGSSGGSTICMSGYACTDWSACANNMQSRTCTLIRPECRANSTKPAESQSCTITSSETQQPSTEAAKPGLEQPSTEEGSLKMFFIAVIAGVVLAFFVALILLIKYFSRKAVLARIRKRTWY